MIISSTLDRLWPRRVALSLVGVLAIAACGLTTSSDSTDTFDQRIAAAIEDAQSNGASEQQIEALRAAQEQGYVSFDIARDAALASVDCMARSGVDATYSERDDGSGVKIPTFVASLSGGDQDAISALVDSCSRTEEAWVSKMYQLQPSTQNARDQNLTRAIPAIRQCLIENGVTVQADASRDEVVQAAIELSRETGSGGDAPPVDCMVEAGVTAY